jgi:hypothetical protein
MGLQSACKLEEKRGRIFFNKDSNESTILMCQMIRYRNRDKGVSIKLEKLMTESHSLDVDNKSYPRLLMLTE